MIEVPATLYSVSGWLIATCFVLSISFIVLALVSLHKPRDSYSNHAGSIAFLALAVILFFSGAVLNSKAGQMNTTETVRNFEETYDIELSEPDESFALIHRTNTQFTNTTVFKDSDPYSVTIRYEDGLYSLWVNDSTGTGQLVPVE